MVLPQLRARFGPVLRAAGSLDCASDTNLDDPKDRGSNVRPSPGSPRTDRPRFSQRYQSRSTILRIEGGSPLKTRVEYPPAADGR